jgi:tripartite-type tricarboxylate transporter receptor subunit TctC
MQQVQHGNQVGFSTRLIASKLNRALLALLALLLSSMSAGLSAQAQAQTQPAGGNWPNKPVRLIVPFGSGGPDSLARILSAQLAQQTGQPWLVENRAGANGILGAELVAKSAPDGYTLMVTSSGFVISPAMYKKLPFDTEKDFTPVTSLVSLGGVFLVVNASVPVQNLAELIALAKKPGNKLAYGSPGIGNTLHLAGEVFNQRAGTSLLHVPYKGAGLAAAAVLGGEIPMMFSTPPAVMNQIRAGKLRALAYSKATRHPVAPDVPTTAEAGLGSYQFDGGWFAMFGPANMPADLLGRVYNEVRSAMVNPSTRERIAALGVEPVANPPAEFRREVSNNIREFAEIARAAGIQPE